MVRSKAREQSEAAILHALFDGAFCPSSGPVIRDFWPDGDTMGIGRSPCREIRFVTYLPRDKSHFAPEGQCLTAATHTLTCREAYVQAALGLGLSGVAVTDHANLSLSAEDRTLA